MNLLCDGGCISIWHPAFLLGLGVTWEDHKLGTVFLEPLHVGLAALNRLVASAVVDSNSERLGLLLAEFLSLDLGEREATSDADLGVVASGWWVDDGAEGATGRGATAAAFFWRAMRRAFFLAGWSNQVFTYRCQYFLKCSCAIMLLCFMVEGLGSCVPM